jgi:hypothetical protein
VVIMTEDAAMETVQRAIVWLVRPGVVHAYGMPDRATAERFAAALSQAWPGVRVWIAEATKVGEMPTIRGSLD